MNFEPSPDQVALGESARRILDDLSTHARLRDLESEATTLYDEQVWKALADAQVLGAVVGEDVGGSGLGPIAVRDVLHHVGRTVAAVPIIETLFMGAIPLGRYAKPELRERYLPGVVEGSVVLSASWTDRGVFGGGTAAVRARPHAEGLVLSGCAPQVPFAARATHVLCEVDAPDGPGVVLIDTQAAGVELVPLIPTSRLPDADIHLHDVVVSPGHVIATGSTARAMIAYQRSLSAAGIATVQAGVCRGALDLTAQYTTSRVQFGRPIGSFQAVAHRAADAFIDTLMVDLTALQALWRIDRGLDAETEVAIASIWAGEGGMRVVHAAQHLHGGIGVDLDYPVHRYFLRAKRNEHLLGTPSRELDRLGSLLAQQGTGAA